MDILVTCIIRILNNNDLFFCESEEIKLLEVNKIH